MRGEGRGGVETISRRFRCRIKRKGKIHIAYAQKELCIYLYNVYMLSLAATT